MSVSLDAANAVDTVAGVSTYTQSFTVGASAKLLLVAVGSQKNPTVNSVTWNGTAMTLIGSVRNTPAGTGRQIYLFGLAAPATGTHDVVTTLSSAFAHSIAISSWNSTSASLSWGTAATLVQTTGTSSSVNTGSQFPFVSYVGIRQSGGSITNGGTSTSLHALYHSEGSGSNQEFAGSYTTAGSTASWSWTTSDNNVTIGVPIIESSFVAGWPVKVKQSGSWVDALMRVRQSSAWVTPTNVSVYHPSTADTDQRLNMPWDLSTTYSGTPPVMAHYVTWFPQRLNSAGTYYQTYYMKPGAVEGATDHRRYGGYARDMPPVQGAGGTTYKADDMYLEVTRAAAAKIDGFFVDMVGITSSSTSMVNLGLLFDAADRYYTETGKRFYITPMLDCHSASASASVLQAGSTTLADVTASANAAADAFAPFMAEPSLWKVGGAIVLPIYAPEHWAGRNNPTSDRVTFFTAMKNRLATYGHAVSFWYCYQATWTSYAGTFDSGAYGHARWGDRDADATAAANNANGTAPSYCASTYSKPWMHFVAPGDSRPNDSQSVILTYSTSASSSSGASTVTYSTGNAANIYKGCTIKFANHATVYTVSQLNRSTGVVTLTSALTAAVPNATSSTVTRNYYRFWEQRGSRTFENTWRAAIDDGAEAVQITTWNDYAEHAHVATTGNHGSVWLDLLTYWLHKFKTGAYPTVLRDGLYLFHRVMPVGLYSFGSSVQVRYGKVAGSTTAADEVEVLAFLTSSATIQLLVDGVVTQTGAGVSGMNRFTWSLPSSGTISARAQRASVTVSGTTVTSSAPVVTSDTADDFHYRAYSSLRQSTGT